MHTTKLGIIVLFILVQLKLCLGNNLLESQHVQQINSREMSIRTIEVEQCGIVSIYAIAKRYNIPINLQSLIDKCPNEVFTQSGMNKETLLNLLHYFSLRSLVVEGSFKDLILPALSKGYSVIVPDWSNPERPHLYVFFSFDEGKILCLNPPRKVSWFTEQEAQRLYSNVGIVVSPDNLAPLSINSSDNNSLVWFIAFCGFFFSGIVILLMKRHNRNVLRILIGISACVISHSFISSNYVLAANEVSNVLEYKHDYGIVEPGKSYTHIFYVMNTFDSPFIVSRIIKGCNCTDIILSNQEIPPGETITAEVTTIVKEGQVSDLRVSSVLVGSLNPPNIIKLIVTGKNKGDNRLDSRLLSSLQEIDLGEVYESKITFNLSFYVQRKDRTSIMLDSVTTSHSAITTIQTNGLNPSKKENRLFLDVQINTSQLYKGAINEWIEIKTKHKEFQTLKIPIIGYVKPNICAKPEKLFIESNDAKKCWGVNLYSREKQIFDIFWAEHTLGEGWGLKATGSRIELCKLKPFANQTGIISGEVKVVLKVEGERGRKNVVVPVYGLWESKEKDNTERSIYPNNYLFELETMGLIFSVDEILKCHNGVVCAEFTLRPNKKNQIGTGHFTFEATDQYLRRPLGVSVDGRVYKQWWAFKPKLSAEKEIEWLPLKAHTFCHGEWYKDRHANNSSTDENLMLKIPLTQNKVLPFSDAVRMLYSKLLELEKSGKETELSLKKKKLPNGFYEIRQCKPSDITEEAFLEEVMSK